MLRNLARSACVPRPHPSAMLAPVETAHRRICDVRPKSSAFGKLFVASYTHLLSRRASFHTSNFLKSCIRQFATTFPASEYLFVAARYVSLRIPRTRTVNRQQNVSPSEAVRLDTWLWAARFFKTRSMAASAINGGKVEVNGARAKPAKQVKPGDHLRVKKGPLLFVLQVLGVIDRRVSASLVSRLYEEDPAAKHERERLAEQLRIAPSPRYQGKGRPTKKERRELDRLSDGSD